jgi:hypothetical protein
MVKKEKVSLEKPTKMKHLSKKKSPGVKRSKSKSKSKSTKKEKNSELLADINAAYKTGVLSKTVKEVTNNATDAAEQVQKLDTIPPLTKAELKQVETGIDKYYNFSSLVHKYTTTLPADTAKIKEEIESHIKNLQTKTKHQLRASQHKMIKNKIKSQQRHQEGQSQGQTDSFSWIKNKIRNFVLDNNTNKRKSKSKSKSKLKIKRESAKIDVANNNNIYSLIIRATQAVDEIKSLSQGLTKGTFSLIFRFMALVDGSPFSKLSTATISLAKRIYTNYGKLTIFSVLGFLTSQFQIIQRISILFKRIALFLYQLTVCLRGSPVTGVSAVFGWLTGWNKLATLGHLVYCVYDAYKFSKLG